MTLKEIVSSCLVIALGIILIVHFTLFWIYGGVFIYENNKVILTLETLMSVTIIGFGFERLLSTSSKRDDRESASVLRRRLQKQASTEQRERGQAPQPLLQR